MRALPALAVAILCAALGRSASAQSAAPADASCGLVTTDEIAQILGFAVSAPDESSVSSGICFYASSAMAEDGSASYAIVDEARLQQRRAYYAVLTRRCAGIAPGASRELECKSFAALAQARDIDEYFAARTDFPHADPVKGLGDAAIAAGDALYVKRGDAVYEVVVRRGDALSVERATTLANLLLARTPNVAGPEPSASPRRPTGL